MNATILGLAARRAASTARGNRQRPLLPRLLAAALCVMAVTLLLDCAVSSSRGPQPFLDGTRFDGPEFLYGSEIGAWPMIENRYDGHFMLNYKGSCPDCPRLAEEANISVIRWGVWNVFDDMDPPRGQAAPPMPRSQFDAVIDGIRSTLGAEPFIKLPPGQSNPGNLFCPETWGEENLLSFDKEVVRQAGPRVQLYDFANEPEIGCGYTRDWPTAGSRVGRLWVRIVPELKKYSRSLGFEIYVGGPAFTTTNINDRLHDFMDVDMARGFMQAIRDEYESPQSPYYHDPDLIPSFYSFHAYGTEYAVNSAANAQSTGNARVQILDAIPRYAAYVDAVRHAIDEVWGPVIGPRIRIAVSEWNYAADSSVDWTSQDVPVYYRQFLAVMRQHGVWLANQFLLASNNNEMDMITRSGTLTPYYQAFKSASLNDPLLKQHPRARPRDRRFAPCAALLLVSRVIPC